MSTQPAFPGPQSSVNVRATATWLAENTSVGSCCEVLFSFSSQPYHTRALAQGLSSHHRAAFGEVWPVSSCFLDQQRRWIRAAVSVQQTEVGQGGEAQRPSRPRGSGREVGAHILAHVALGGGVEGGELHVAGVLGPHLVKHLLKGVKSAVWRVHVVLVHLQEGTGWRQSSQVPQKPDPPRRRLREGTGAPGQTAARQPAVRPSRGHHCQARRA